ncbi:hypothetical protein [Pseudactinotalea terrae]|uniref:hypothetical protein n=1 Tax=Pseudactinotalea terrae TaxID=1743262 RepID=UPI0012E116A8|nr:hypothetical protein [Pseudactinotalea terrae]
MTDTAARSRQPQGVTTGGQFATEPRSETGVTLNAASPTRVRVDINATAHFSSDYMRPLPSLPASLGEPELSYDRDPESDDITLSVTTDLTGAVLFWGDGDTFKDGLYDGESISSNERDALIAYGTALRTNVDVLQFEVDAQARKAVESEVLAVATGSRPQMDDTTPADNGARRADRVMRAWVDEVDEEPETALQDAFTDLLHFASSRGIDPEVALGKAFAMAAEEREEQAALTED